MSLLELLIAAKNSLAKFSMGEGGRPLSLLVVDVSVLVVKMLFIKERRSLLSSETLVAMNNEQGLTFPFVIFSLFNF